MTRRRAAALALAALAAAAAYAFIVRPVQDAHRDLNTRTAAAEAQLARYRALARERELHERSLAALQRADPARAHYLPGRNAALASASLQGLVKRAVEAGGGELLSLQVLPARSDASEVVVRARARGDVRMLQALLHALESGSPILVLDNFAVDASDNRMTVTLDVAGRWRERAPEAGPPPAAASRAGMERYAEIVERTLFHPSRRALAPMNAAAPAAQLRLVGVLLDANRQLALLSDPSSPWLVRVQPGEALGDWTLAEVRRDHVVLRRGTETRLVAVEP